MDKFHSVQCFSFRHPLSVQTVLMNCSTIYHRTMDSKPLLSLQPLLSLKPLDNYVNRVTERLMVEKFSELFLWSWVKWFGVEQCMVTASEFRASSCCIIFDITLWRTFVGNSWKKKLDVKHNPSFARPEFSSVTSLSFWILFKAIS